MRGSSSFPTTKSWRANVFPVQTEQARNINYMANTFPIWKKLQADFIELTSFYVQAPLLVGEELFL